jgi:hypothetical protein
MAGAALTPRVRIMAVCDRVRASTTESGVFHLRGVRQGIHAAAFPFVPYRLSLFLLLSSPHAGVYPGYVRVVNARTDKAIYYSHLSPSPRFEGDIEFLALRPRMRCSFAEPGRHIVEVCFFQERGSDIVKGELPLFLAQNGV